MINRNDTIKRIFFKLIVAAVLLANGVNAQTSITDVEKANADMMRNFLGTEAAKAGIEQDDRDIVDSAGANSDETNRGVEGLSVDIGSFRVKTPQPASKDLGNLFKKRMVKAVRGDVDAQLKVGLMYAVGEGVAQNYKKAAKWLLNPAEQGYDLAQFILGEIYATGRGAAKDYQKAASWYSKAAEQDNADAQYRIGVMYAEGKGVQYNPNKAEMWLRKAAEQGDAKMQFSLGERYANGLGVPHNSKEAEKWFREAAKQGDANMQFFLGRLYREPGEVVAQDREEAVLWFSRAAEQGHAAAKFNLGVMYLNGEGILVDMVQAHKWLTLAAASGNKDALKDIQIAESRMSQEQIKEAQRLASEWLAKYK